METSKNLTGFWNHLLFISFGLISIAVIVLPLGSTIVGSISSIGLALVGVYVLVGIFGWNWIQSQQNPRAILIYFVVQAAIVYLTFLINLIAFEQSQISLLAMPIMYQSAIFSRRMRLLLLGSFMAFTLPINLIFGSSDLPTALRNSLLMFFFSGIFILLGSIVIREEQQTRHIQTLLRTLESNHETEIRRLESIQAIRRQLIDTATHDLRNPLVIILGYVHLIEAKGKAYADDELRQYAEGISQTSARIKNMIGHMLDLSQVESSLGLQLESQRLTAFVAPIIQEFNAAAQQKQLALSYHSAPEDPEVRIDIRQMRRAIENLIHNALKFTPPQGKIDVATGSLNGQAWITIRNTGPSIPPDALKHLFEPFYRVESNNVEGSGLGLTIAKTIVEQHHGQIWVESQPGQGTTFKIEMPVA